MLNSHQRCSDSSIFCINAKTCTFRYLDEFFQANSFQRIITGFLRRSFFNTAPDFIWESVVDAGVSQDSAERVRMFLTMAIYRKLGIHVQGQEMSARLSL